MTHTYLSSPKRKKQLAGHKNRIDRLSNLPDSILIKILSLLPTETAVATSVLSKSWESLWTFLRDLDFEESRNRTFPEFRNSSQEERRDRRFANFVTKVLLHRQEWSIRRFRLELHSQCRSTDLDLWVSSALARDVQELDLHFTGDSDESPVLPLQQSWKTLSVLKLKSVAIAGRFDRIFFPTLKILHLKSVELRYPRSANLYRREFSLGTFLVSRTFPVLEELVFVNEFEIYYSDNIQISLHNLRSLYIAIRPENAASGLKYALRTLRIDCPALRSLDFHDHVFREIHLETLPNLVEAYIYVSNIESEDGDETYGRYLMNLVKAMSSVRTLTLSYSTMNEIEEASDFENFRWEDIPIFHNLVRVELNFEGSAWNILMPMLDKFENLECLTLCPEYDEGVNERVEWIEPRNVPDCLIFNVTTVCFKEFRGLAYEMRVARYILESSLVLMKATFMFPFKLSIKEGCRIRRELSQLHKSSEFCQLEYI